MLSAESRSVIVLCSSSGPYLLKMPNKLNEIINWSVSLSQQDLFLTVLARHQLTIIHSLFVLGSCLQPRESLKRTAPANVGPYVHPSKNAVCTAQMR